MKTKAAKIVQKGYLEKQFIKNQQAGGRKLSKSPSKCSVKAQSIDNN